MDNQIILTTGVYDAIKEHLRRRQVSQEEENQLTTELRHARQVLRRELPEDVVTVNKVVTIKDHTKETQHDYILVSSNKAKPKKNKYSILSDIALAAVGYKVGDVIEWPFKGGDRKIEIMKVENWVEKFS